VVRAIASILAQDVRDFELVVVDDASTDNTVAVIEAFRDPRIVLLRQPENRQAGAARNRAIREARSELIAFIDSDDEYLPHKLSFLVDYFQRNPEIDVLLDSFTVTYPAHMRRQDAARINPVLTDNEAILAGVYARRISKATPALSARRQALLDAGLFDESLGRRQDFELVVRLTRSCRCATTDQVLWRKHWTEGAITAQLRTRMDAILEMCARDPAYLTTPRYRIGVARDLAHHVLKLIRKGQPALLGHDLRRFASAHGTGTTARLLVQGSVETVRRAVTGKR
jgi:glycosyltransferase involved in cell wall biosynthesis